MRFRSALSAFGSLLFLSQCSNEKGLSIKEGFIPAGGLKVYYEKTGSGSPVVLIHAGLQNHHMWAEQVKALSPTHTVVTIDLPFHGQTEGADSAILAKDVVRIVLDSLQIQKAAIAGLSMGAAVAQDFVIGYPGRVSKAVFLSAGINGYERHYPIDSITTSWYPRFSAALEARDTPRAAMVFAQSWGEGVKAAGNKVSKPAAKNVYETTLATLRKHKAKTWPNLQDEPPAMDGIPSIQVPVLIIHADEDLPFIAVASRYLEKTIPGAKRVELKGAAHMLNLEQPDAVNKLLLDFFERVVG